MAKEKVLNKTGLEVVKDEVEKMIPTSLPANGGNADTLDGLVVEDIANNENLLDNSAFHYNQRGKTSYTTSGYTIDRWKITANSAAETVGTLTTIDNGITLTATSGSSICLSQVVETKIVAGTTVTMSVKVENINGTWEMLQLDDTTNKKSITATGWQTYTFEWASPVSEHGSFAIRSTGTGSITISAVKLEYGQVCTKYTIPKGDVETSQCKRFFAKVQYGTPLSSCWGTGSSTLRLLVYTPSTMNERPTATIEPSVTSGWTMEVYDTDGTLVHTSTDIPTATVNRKSGNVINITLTFSGNPNFIGHKSYVLGGSGFTVALSADYA